MRSTIFQIIFSTNIKKATLLSRIAEKYVLHFFKSIYKSITIVCDLTSDRLRRLLFHIVISKIQMHFNSKEIAERNIYLKTLMDMRDLLYEHCFIVVHQLQCIFITICIASYIGT